MKEKGAATVGCAVGLCALVSPWCEFANTILNLLRSCSNFRSEKRGREGSRGGRQHVANKRAEGSGAGED